MIAAGYTVTPAQREQLDRLGFFITDVVFDAPTLEEMRSEFERLWMGHLAHAQKHNDAKWIRLTRSRPFFSQLDRSSAACDAFCRHPVFLDIGRQLVGPDLDMTWNQAIIRPPPTPEDDFEDNSFAFHQDQWYALKGPYARDCNMEILTDNSTGITAWVAISRTTVDNGTLWVLPGRHKEGLLPHQWCEERNEWQGQYDTSYRVPVVMEAGQMVVFRRYLPHGSGANVTKNETRMAYQIGYGKPGLKLAPSNDLVPVMRGGEAVKK